MREPLPPERVDETIDDEIDDQDVKRWRLTPTGDFEVSYDELVAAIPHQEQLDSDETSLKNNGKKLWIWCIKATAFSVLPITSNTVETTIKQINRRVKGTEKF
ncbi:MAG: hypothetical protein IT427_13395 [Pirellulales bacterium]|nr:hypothetical protein [Pirellulales bacterium]